MNATILPNNEKHYPVLLNEILSIISPQNGGTFIDCTFGQGGYSKAFLKFNKTNVIAIDRDVDCKIIAQKIKNLHKERFIFFHKKFSDIDKIKINNSNMPNGPFSPSRISFGLETRRTKVRIKNAKAKIPQPIVV